MKKRILLTLILWTATAAAKGDGDRDLSAFAGVGLFLGQMSLNPAGVGDPSNFKNQGYLLEGGFSVPFSSRFGAQASGEIGQSNAINTIVSESYLEAGTLNFYSAKFGLFYGPVTMGVGYRHNAVEIKSVSTEEETGFQKSVYSGWNTFLYGNISMDFLKRYRGAVEAQYQRGDLGSGPAGANTVGFTEISISLRAYLLFD